MYSLYVLVPFVLLTLNVVNGLPYSNYGYMPAFGLLQLVIDNDNFMRITWGLRAFQHCMQRGAFAL